MKNLVRAAYVAVVALSASLVQAQSLRIQNDSMTVKVPSVFENRVDMKNYLSVTSQGTGDALDIKSNGNVLESGADLIWGCFYQAQPNNPGIFSLTSYSAGFSWNPCFTVRANGNVGIFNSNPGVALSVGTASTPRQVAVNGTIVLGSDSKLKENIREISSGSFGKLSGLQGVSYR